MEPTSRASLEERIERLERLVEALHARLEGADGRSSAASVPPRRRLARGVPASRASPVRGEIRADAWAHWSEQWVGRVGLGLLFLGLVYLFNYSIEQGWITPAVRVAIGIGIASILLALGIRLQRSKPSFSQLLLAGALALYYVSGFAAFTLFHLISYGIAFAYMAGVMLLALVLALRQHRPTLASLGALGGLVTPLVLQRASPAVTELSVYTLLVLSWAAPLYWLRGWPSLLWTYATGGLAVLSIAVQHGAGLERWVVQAALLFVWFAGAVLPFIRGIRHPESRIGLRRLWGVVPAALQLRVLGVGGTGVALLLSSRVWDFPRLTSGSLFVAAAAGYALLAWRGTAAGNLVTGAAAPVAAALLATGTFLIIDREPLRVLVLAAEAAAFLRLGRNTDYSGLSGVGHALFGVLAIKLIAEAASAAAAFDLLAFAQLGALAVALLAALRLPARRLAWSYFVGVHALFLVWLAKEFGQLALGSGMVTLSWGSYGAALLFLALRWRDARATPTHALQLVAFSAIALAVFKLLVIDLERVPILWRIGMFIGFGAALLVLSSLFKTHGVERTRPAA